ncbi:MAG TPA: YhjD/YihY/BrkB family envelope integrity protein [Solirubrobacteraceae bacterium]|jgi:YihY family inner membrane protein|nr:YhjD/YihY/BrkB family envelope integrity protein [Solirubrobacteraceae bacterium]
MEIPGPLRTFDRYQQRHPAIGFPIAVLKKFSDDQAGGLAALIAYYAFFSLIPLLLVFSTGLAFVLHGHPSIYNDVRNSTLSEFPIIGDHLKQGPSTINGSGLALVVGIVGALLPGLGATQAAQNAFDQVWAVPHKDRPNFLIKRVRGLGMLVTLGTLNLASTVLAGLVTGSSRGILATVAGIVVTLLVNVAIFIMAFRLLTSKTIELRCLIPGALIAAVFWAILQAVGGIYISHVYKHASAVNSIFELVIPLLTWLYLGAQVTLYSLEIDVVRARHLWPRSLFDDPQSGADHETLRGLAKIEERNQNETVDVTFHVDPVDPAQPAESQSPAVPDPAGPAASQVQPGRPTPAVEPTLSGVQATARSRAVREREFIWWRP